jgi:hypothetical protein
MPNFELTITGDFNDADYVSKVSKISQEYLDFIMPIIEAIKNFKRGQGGSYYNYQDVNPLRAILPEQIYPQFHPDMLLDFDGLVPHPGNYGGCHTITRIEIAPWRNKKRLL